MAFDIREIHMKKKPLVLLAALAALGAAGASQAQEMGRVISSTPQVQQVTVPRQVCSMVPVAVQAPKSGAGALMGALAGGAIGNAIGDGGGRAAATALGIMGGAIMGDRVEGSPAAQMQQVQQCNTQYVTENQPVGYSVVYEYAGKQYQVQMPNDPGQFVPLQVSPVGAAAPAQAPAYASAPPVYAQPPVYTAPVVITSGTYYQPYYQPYYPTYVRPYYPPVGVSLNFGYSSGYYGHRHHR
jgi:uncharacterized protein YcfJ